MKKLLTLLILLIIGTAVMGYFYFSKIHQVKSGNDRALSVATLNAAMVVEFTAEENFFELMSEQSLLSNFLGTNAALELEAIKTKLSKSSTSLNKILGNKLFLSFVTDQKQNEYVVSTQLQKQSDLGNLVKELMEKGVLKNENNHLYTFHANDSLELFAGVKEDVFLVSPSKSVILERLNLVENTDKDFKDYIELRQSISKSKLMTIYLNLSKIDSYALNMMVGRLDGELAFLNKNNSFAEFSYNFSKDKLQLFGTTTMGKKSSYYDLFKNLNGVPFTINGLLPHNTSSYKFYGIDQTVKFQELLAKFFKEQNNSQLVEKTLKEISTKYNLDLRKLISENFNKELITFQLTTGERLGAIQFKNGDKMSQIMAELGEYSESNIGIFKDEQILYALFGDAFKRFNRPYFVIRNNTLIFAPNSSTLRDYLANYDAGKLLIKDTSYSKFRNEFPGDASLIFYFDLNASKTIVRNNLKSTYYRTFLANSGWGEFAHFAYQLTGDKGKFNSNILIDKKLPKSESASEINLKEILEEIDL